MERNHTNDNPQYGHGKAPVDLQIVGGGLGGLLAANLAVDAGLTVRLIEQSRQLGGRATTDDYHGYSLNLGPHAIYLDGQFKRALASLRLNPPGVDLNSKATGTLSGRFGRLPAGPFTLARTPLLSPGAKVELAAFMARLPRMDSAELASVSVTEWLADTTDRADLRGLLNGLVTIVTYNADSDRASADAGLNQLKMILGSGVRYLHHGWGSLVRALDARLDGAADRGVLERVTAKVSAVEPGAVEADAVETGAALASGQSATTVRTADGQTLTATTCLVAAGGPAVADRLLGLDQTMAGLAGSPVEMSVLDLGLTSPPRHAPHFALDARLYGSTHSIASGLAPADRHLTTLALYRTADDDEATPQETRALLMSHADAMGIDPSTVDMDRYLHRLTVAWGAPQAASGGLAGRPDVTVADRPGVFVVGDWVGRQGLLADAVAASAGEAVTACQQLVESAAAAAPLPVR